LQEIYESTSERERYHAEMQLGFDQIRQCKEVVLLRHRRVLVDIIALKSEREMASAIES